jgi:hypothetical protein
MTARAGPGAGRLERGYRRLLACYPPLHRREHGEEMLGVLLAAAPDGQRRPTAREAADLLRGAARIWLAAGPARPPGTGWRAALAIVSVALPVAALIEVASTWAFLYPLGAPHQPESPWMPVVLLVAFGLSGQGIIVPLVLLRLRRTAAGVAVLVALPLLAWAAFALVKGLADAEPDFTSMTFSMVCYVTEAAALLSAGELRGRRLVTRRGAALVVTAALAAGLIQAVFYTFVVVEPQARPSLADLHARPPGTAWLGATAAAAALVLLLTAARAARRAPGRRVLIVLAIPASALLAMPYWWPRASSGAAIGYLPPLVIAAAAIVAAGWSRRTRPARAGSGP